MKSRRNMRISRIREGSREAGKQGSREAGKEECPGLCERAETSEMTWWPVLRSSV
jgi:hypothetical protein